MGVGGGEGGDRQTDRDKRERSRQANSQFMHLSVIRESKVCHSSVTSTAQRTKVDY